MKYCSSCVYPENHPLGIAFDDLGVCSGCQIHKEKYVIDWDEKLNELKNIVNPYRSKQRTISDCVVPVSGGRDSYYVVHMVKNVLGLNPLLVTYNKHYNTKLGNRNLAYLKSIFGCPLLTLTVDPAKVKTITRETIEKLGSIYWHCLAGQTVFPVQTAYRFKIPLIIWGCHQGLDQVGMYSHSDEVEMTRKYRKEHDLMGYEAEDLEAITALGLDDLVHFLYPNDKEVEAVGIRGIYLNNYIMWDSISQHKLMVDLYGYETRDLCSTFDSYNDVDCVHYSGLHNHIKQIKYGFGKITDHVSREIRLRRISRNQGIALVKYFSAPERSDVSLFLEWIGLSAREFSSLIEKHRNRDLWRKDSSNNWQHQEAVYSLDTQDSFENVEAILKQQKWDRRSSRVDFNESIEYELLARAWVD